MKKFFLGFIALCLFIGTATAQETGKKAWSKAKKSLVSHHTAGPAADGSDLKQAVEMIDVAMEDSEVSADIKAWKTKGEVYSAAVDYDMQARLLNPEHQIMFADAAVNSYQAYRKMFDMAEKKHEKRSALEGMSGTASNISNSGVALYEGGNYEAAFNSFKTVLEIHNILKENGEKGVLETEDDYNNQLYITGLAALQANDVMSAKTYFQELYDKQYDKAAVYEALYKVKAQDGDEAGALTVLEEGRKKFPDDVSLLFAEINHYLKQNKLDVLVGKLKTAIEKEPENVSLYSTLGNVYDNLFQKELEAGNDEKADEYFNSALDYYNQALAKKPDFLDAIYSVGALYYNKAAAKTKEMNELPISKVKEFEALKKESEELFDQALPFFKKAEQNDPNDLNTLIALKEIYARKNDFETSGAFKERMAKVQAGEKNETPYFNE